MLQSLTPGQAEAVQAAWLYPGVAPRGLACDATGRRLLVTEGL